MSLDTRKLRQLREARGWSQEHLAQVASISVRTLQRMEAEGSASAESRLAVAAALEIDARQLAATETPAASPEPRERSYDWTFHLVVYGLACAFFISLNLWRSGGLGWAPWPILGWGVALLLRAWHRQRKRRRRTLSGVI